MLEKLAQPIILPIPNSSDRDFALLRDLVHFSEPFQAYWNDLLHRYRAS